MSRFVMWCRSESWFNVSKCLRLLSRILDTTQETTMNRILLLLIVINYYLLILLLSIVINYYNYLLNYFSFYSTCIKHNYRMTNSQSILLDMIDTHSFVQSIFIAPH